MSTAVTTFDGCWIGELSRSGLLPPLVLAATIGFHVVKEMMRHMMILTHNQFLVLGDAITLAVSTSLDTNNTFLVLIPPGRTVHHRLLAQTVKGIDGRALLIELGGIVMGSREPGGERWGVGVRHLEPFLTSAQSVCVPFFITLCLFL